MNQELEQYLRFFVKYRQRDWPEWLVTAEFTVNNKAVRRGSHRGESPQNVLGDEQTCGTTLTSAYVLHRLSVTWSQLQMKERSPSESEC